MWVRIPPRARVTLDVSSLFFRLEGMNLNATALQRSRDVVASRSSRSVSRTSLSRAEPGGKEDYLRAESEDPNLQFLQPWSNGY